MHWTFRRTIKLFRDLPIRRKLILLLNVQIIIPLILLGYLSYKNSENIIKKKTVDYSQDIIRMIDLRLRDYVNHLTVLSQDLLYEKKVYSILSSDNSDQDPLSSYEYKNDINNILKKMIDSREEVRFLCLISNHQNSYYPYKNSEEAKNIWDQYDKLLETARKAQGRAAWYLDSEGDMIKNLYLVRTINDHDKFKEVGLLVMLVNRDFLEVAYQGLTGNMKNIAVLSPSNQCIIAKNPQDEYLFKAGLTDATAGRSGTRVDNETGLLISHMTLKDTGWKVVAYATLNDLYKEAGVLRTRIIVLSVLSVSLLSIISMFIAIDFTNPINRLVNAMKKVQKGDGGVQIKDDRNDEFGFLNRAFNDMSKEIEHLVTWVYREQITRKEAEIKALQSQINPHFLFNTLESINWMAQLNHVPEISEMVSDLSALMEASIGREEKLITVHEEFSYADKYISLLKRRFEDKLELRKEVAPDALRMRIPRLLIQPLIENAVYHGVEVSRGKGIIQLKASILEDVLCIEVADNGRGMEQWELDAINDRLSMNNDVYFRMLGQKRSKSIGIENVHRRIKLFYGENYGLKIESEYGVYTRVIVTLPTVLPEIREGYYV